MARDRRDRSQNWYMDHHGGSLLRLVPVTGIVRWQAAQNVLGYPKQMPDGLLDVTFEGKKAPDPFLIEIESYPQQDTVEQIRRDFAMVLLTRRVIPDILLLVLQPKGNLRIDPEQIANSVHGLTELRLKIHVVNLWTVPAEDLLAAGDVGLIPWVPLARHTGSPRTLLTKCRDRIEEQAQPEEKDNLLAVTRTMAEARYNDVELLSLLGGQTMSFTKVLLETPAGKRFLAKTEKDIARKTARKTARITARKTVCKSILDLLGARFGPVPIVVTRRLRTIDRQETLEALLQTAALCADWKGFQEALDKA